METIEERAIEYAYKEWTSEFTDVAKTSYELGATEQKAIDEAKLLKLKSSWEKEAQINHDDEANYKQGYHDAVEKAWSFVYSMYQVGRDNLTPLTKDEFIKAMEEKI